MFNPESDYDVRIISDDGSSRITCMLSDYINGQSPGISCEVQISDREFKGLNKEVWILQSDLIAFINALKKLDKTRFGRASLSAMSKEDFQMTLENANEKGDIVLFYSLAHLKFTRGMAITNTLIGGFQLDSEYFSRLVSDFGDLLAAVESHG